MQFNESRIKKMLPKTYFRKYVAHQVFVAITYFKHLVPVMDEYVYKDGTTKQLLSLTGTVPITVADKTYNIPICVWIEHNYPNSAPICYVKPTQELLVVRGTFVSADGEIKLPYLKEWKRGDCDLIGLLQVMAAMFGEFPPLAMRPLPEPEKTYCWLQFHRQTDGKYFVSLSRDDGQPFQNENETSC